MDLKPILENPEMITAAKIFDQATLAVLPPALVSEVVRLVNESPTLVSQLTYFNKPIIIVPPSDSEGGHYSNPKSLSEVICWDCRAFVASTGLRPSAGTPGQTG